ncbi:MAG: hypothetical protein ACOZQL_32995 [Myxococcota bacterium]
MTRGVALALLLLSCGSVPLRFGADDAGVDAGRPPVRCDARDRCVECLSHTDCSGSTPICDPSLGRCVPCAGSLGCPSGSTCNHSTCVPSCTDSSACGGFTAGCVDNVCAMCADDEDCGAGLHCDHETGRCVACRSDGDCAAPAPRCQQWTGTCVACVTESDCGGPGQACLGGRCVLR